MSIAVTQLDPRLTREGHGAYRFLHFVLGGRVRRFLGALDDPRGAQERRLRALLKLARGTDFGTHHDLERVRTLDELREAVPIRSHAEYSPWLDRVASGERRVLSRQKTSLLLETSGTTGRPKHLPVNAAWSASVQDAQRIWTLALLRDHPELAHGSALTVVSPRVTGQSAGGIPIGSNTGRIRQAQPRWLRDRYVVPDAVLEISDPIARQYALLRFALQSDVRSITTANPSMVLLLCRRLEEWREPLSEDLMAGTLRAGPASGLPGDLRSRLERTLVAVSPQEDWRPASLWNLASVNCWTGGPAAYFAHRLPEALGSDIPVRELGINASEGTFAIPLAHDWPGSVLWTLGHVLEFVGDDGRARFAWELEEGEQVRLVVSTEAGLWRYDLDDVVEVVGRCQNTPVVRFVGKAGRYLNCLGERITASQVSEAVHRASAKVNCAPVGFTVRIQGEEQPRYQFAFESNGDVDLLAGEVDAALFDLNVEYAGKRKSGRLGTPVAFAVPMGTYARYRLERSLEGAPEGQVKDPILALDRGEWVRVVGEENA